MQVAEARVKPERQHRVYWWKEALIVVAFYLLYSWTRNQFGSNAVDPGEIPHHAFNNAERVIRFEDLIGLYHEETLQELFLPYRAFIQFWNTYYGTAHFIVTLVVFALLFRKRPAVFPVWRNSLAIMTALAIVGFALFPLMPPRLLDEPCAEYGGACIESDLRGEGGSFGFVDTLADYGGPWSFDSETMTNISNQYAAMPSMHIGWSTWCAVAMWPLLRRRWQRVAVFLYPMATLFCIIVTGNHFWIDGAGGLLAFALGTVIGWGMYRWNQNRLDRKHAALLETAATGSA
jgi:cytochrome bd-type quinol oxidase subunit 2